MITREITSLFARPLAVFVITFQIGVGLPMLTYAAPSRPTLSQEDYARPLINKLMLDPVFAEFAKQPPLPAPGIDAKDPAVDQDPFFLRSQSWNTAPADADRDEPSFTKGRDASLTLNLPKASKSLHIAAPLTPVLFTDEYVFLTLDEGSDMFAKASGTLAKGETVGEGVFFINYQEWLKASQVAAPVKVFFFPMPGHGWTGQIEADHFADVEMLSLGNREGDWVPVSDGDIAQVEKVQTLNALLGAVVAARTGSMTSADANRLFPARGSTYGFGMMFTGFDLENPANSAYNILKAKVQPFIAKVLKHIGIQEAKADLNISADLVTSLIRFGWTFGAFTATAIALKYTVLRDKFAVRHALRDLRTVPELEFDVDQTMKIYDAGIASREALSKANAQELATATKLDLAVVQTLITSAGKPIPVEPAPTMNGAKGVFGKTAAAIAVAKNATAQAITRVVPAPVRKASTKALREVVENGDVLASVLTTVSQFPTVFTANLIERYSDRYMPEKTAGSNRLMRKALNYTFYWARSVSTNTPVSMKTFMLGGVLMGTIDTYFVYVQQVAFIPAVAQAIAPHLPPALEQRIYDTYDPGNEQMRSLIVNDVIRNFVGWMTAGASGYSQDTQAQVEPLMRKSVDDALKRMGKNPLDPKIQEERDRLYQAAMNTKLKQLGLPDQVDFLFDANTIDKVVLQKLGFRITDAEMKASEEKSLIGQSRPGLIKSALVRAIEIEKENLAQASSPARVQALRILEDMRKGLSLMSFDPRNPIRSLQQRREVTKMLTLMTYSGDVDTLVRHVPDLWTNVDPDGAREAAVRFRQAFFAFYTGDGTLVNLPEDFVTTHIDEMKKAATAELTSKYHLDSGSIALLNTKHRAEFGLLVEQKLREKYAATRQFAQNNGLVEKDANLYQRMQQQKAYKEGIHDTASWYEKIQHKRAYRKTMERALSETGSTSQESMNKYYAEAMANEVGLYPPTKNLSEEERSFLEFVVTKAAEDTKSELSHEPLKTHLEKISQAERTQIELSLYAKNYLSAYRDGTVNEGLVPPRSQVQPGFTQRFRQNHKDSKILTILARIVDSGFSDEVGYQTGLKAKLYRNIPALYDLASNIARTPKGMVTGMTVRWEYNRVLWGVNIPWGSYFLLFLVSPLTGAPSQWLNRAMRQQGLQPMGGFFSKTIYGVPYAWVTFGSIIPWALYSKDAMIWMKAVSGAVAANPIIQTIMQMGEASLPYLPALAVIPIVNEIRARRANRQAMTEAASKLINDRDRNAVDLGGLPFSVDTSEILKNLPKPLTGQRCEAMFQPALR